MKMKLHRWTVTLSVSEFRSLPLRYPGNKQATALDVYEAFSNNDCHMLQMRQVQRKPNSQLHNMCHRTRMERSAQPQEIRPQTSGQSNSTKKPHRHRTWMVQSYMPGGAFVHPNLICIRVHIPNDFLTGSAVFAQLTQKGPYTLQLTAPSPSNFHMRDHVPI